MLYISVNDRGAERYSLLATDYCLLSLWFIIPAISRESERTRRCLIPRPSRASAYASTV